MAGAPTGTGAPAARTGGCRQEAWAAVNQTLKNVFEIADTPGKAVKVDLDTIITRADCAVDQTLTDLIQIIDTPIWLEWIWTR